MVSKETKDDSLKISRNKVINNIHEFAANQITAEGNGTFEVLMTESIQNLIRKYKNSIPNTVIMGAKGSGKTFLYREMLRINIGKSSLNVWAKMNQYRKAWAVMHVCWQYPFWLQEMREDFLRLLKMP